MNERERERERERDFRERRWRCLWLVESHVSF